MFNRVGFFSPWLASDSQRNGGPEDIYKEMVMISPGLHDRVVQELLQFVSRPILIDRANPRQTVTARPAVELPIPVLAAKPIERETLVGTWLAAFDDGSTFELVLRGDDSFHWMFTWREMARGFGGLYYVNGNILTLQRKTGGSLTAVMVAQDDRRFNFKLQGGSVEDPGLNFSWIEAPT